ncbi:hypothetical protein [Pontibacter arcticus]|uniref:Uncharacterized protein n=1 Tax=Pontibacter arcticus TaxID=2080288 RepID=A0A364REY5_9BACT|nr:hypothetical protein [Pontibacter arcticus]RAU82900.1 hypothetical protein DP923_06540 [Pontibacter arcticus]
MIEKVQLLLQEFEQKQEAGEIETFTVQIFTDSLHIKPEPGLASASQRIDLSTELLLTFEIFLSDTKVIVHNSPEYLTLKSLLNTQGTLERMAQNKTQE